MTRRAASSAWRVGLALGLLAVLVPRDARTQDAGPASAACTTLGEVLSAPGNMAMASSRKENRQLGSSPTSGTPRAKNGASAASVRVISAFAASTLPTAR